ncbi:MAG: hypothetical protein PF588_07605 [Candidatus Kapabacteria bacterium]|nr:hypothetical protein [Candidatus Kapabacteria bacterium]
MKKILIILFMLSMITIASAAKKQAAESVAQAPEMKTAFIGFGLDLMLPRGENATKNDNFGVAVDLNGGYQFEGLPIIIGGEFLFGGYTGGYEGTAYFDDFSNDKFDISTESNIISLMAYVRFQSDGEYFQPYIEALAGFKVLWTATEYDYTEYWEEDDTDTNIDFSDFVLSYGVGFGFLVPISKTKEGAESIFLDFNFKYLFGANAEYLKDYKFIGDYGYYSFVTGKSRTDSYTIRLGIGFRI